jgi:CRISPR/Cas system-associated endonuclease Cas1
MEPTSPDFSIKAQQQQPPTTSSTSSKATASKRGDDPTSALTAKNYKLARELVSEKMKNHPELLLQYNFLDTINFSFTLLFITYRTISECDTERNVETAVA